MQIIFVDWIIIKGNEQDFKNYWKTALLVEDRSPSCPAEWCGSCG